MTTFQDLINQNKQLEVPCTWIEEKTDTQLIKRCVVRDYETNEVKDAKNPIVIDLAQRIVELQETIETAQTELDTLAKENPKIISQLQIKNEPS
jgi:hypothetical protein